MPLDITLIFFIVAAALVGIVFALWRYWESVARVSPEEEAFDKRVAALNERQSNRMSDDLLRTDLSNDSAWQIMIERGRRAARRRSRYGGNLERRARERRRRP